VSTCFVVPAMDCYKVYKTTIYRVRYIFQKNGRISRTCTAGGTPQVGRELRAVMSTIFVLLN